MNFVNSLGFKVYSDTLSKIPIDGNKCKLLCTISPNSYGISTKDAEFKRALQNTDYLVLDGVYFALASMLLQGKNIKRNQGADVHYHFMKRVNEKRGKAFYLGTSEDTLDKIRKKAAIEYPDLSVATYSPPYKQEFSADENKKMIEAVNVFGPDVLFVGMTCPKQEKWANQHKEQLKTNLICCIGAVFDWYAGNEKTIAPIWWSMRLGWLIRTINRPEILKRYPNIGIFFRHLFLALFGIKKYRYGQF